MRSLIRSSFGAVLLIAVSLSSMEFFVATEHGSEPALAGPGAALSLDMDAQNGSGACDPIDSNIGVGPGSPFQVAVCLSNSGSVPVAAFQYQIIYNDSAISVPNEANVGAVLDDNPDANAGTLTYTRIRIIWAAAGTVAGVSVNIPKETPNRRPVPATAASTRVVAGQQPALTRCSPGRLA
jgi:hypothetical protein